MSPVRYELGSHIRDDILHSHRRENLKSYKSMKTITEFVRLKITTFQLGDSTNANQTHVNGTNILKSDI
jgi:hypothetical protein